MYNYRYVVSQCLGQVAVEGNIASGKSTLLRKLSQLNDIEVSLVIRGPLRDGVAVGAGGAGGSMEEHRRGQPHSEDKGSGRGHGYVLIAGSDVPGSQTVELSLPVLCISDNDGVAPQRGSKQATALT